MSAILGRLIDQGKVPETALHMLLRGYFMWQAFRLRRGLDPATFLQLWQNAPLMSEELSGVQGPEVPVEFFERFLGKRLFAAGAYWPTGILALDEAEEQMLGLICKHARIQDGMDVLELGAQWGALSLWMAEHYPRSVIISVAENKAQRDFIEAQSRLKGLKNLQAFAYDLNDFNVSTEFDRIISVELFNHARNFLLLAQRIAGWLKQDGKLFVQLVTHKQCANDIKYLPSLGWLHENFLRGMILPPHDLPKLLSAYLSLEQDWALSGRHYQRAADTWLSKLERQEMQVLPILARVYGDDQKELWYRRWKFYLSLLSALFGTHSGEEWQISHYLMQRLSAV
ncbi:MAG: class I SAM-dependent methyltransferase [Oligoflexia bacterium]|nr:class I SAM-dependent methyltransferase [Oligoflexia bacterium]